MIHCNTEKVPFAVDKVQRACLVKEYITSACPLSCVVANGNVTGSKVIELDTKTLNTLV